MTEKLTKPWEPEIPKNATDEQLKQQGAELARYFLPSFCTVLSGAVAYDFDPIRRTAKRTPAATFTFPGAQGEGTWRLDQRDMAMLEAEDYDTYQALKESGGV
ncbi:hypothetical protein [Fodinicurvata sediminis]|uniref:hypothetical protein n=1 Tax=Fodinicurvata sediminis TaxID=1121832 RepID=UPI0003B595C5|nr:hypothetical protein [Fodinicurvata sediminis]